MMQLARYATVIISLFNGKNYNLNKDTIRSAFKKQNYSNDKIKKALNLEFRPVTDSISEICLNLKTN
jgi:dihydroflavonol-4-reductase